MSALIRDIHMQNGSGTNFGVTRLGGVATGPESAANRGIIWLAVGESARRSKQS